MSRFNQGPVKYYLLRSNGNVHISDHAQGTYILSKTKNTSLERERIVSVPLWRMGPAT